MYKRVLKRFTNWINANYDSENELVQEKLEHTYAVLDVATKIVSNENLSQEDILIAQIIAILHDCGRFPQIELFGSFKDTDEFKSAKNLIKEENYVDRLTDIFLEKRSYYNKADVEWAREIANSFLK